MAREMKDSGIMWIGKIPSNWNITRVKYICESYGRIGFRGYTENDLVDEGEGAITISPSNMKNMKMDYSKCSYLSWNKYEESPEIKLSNNDVLFVKTGSTYGKTAIVENLPMEATINPQLLIFKNIKIYTKYFFYNFQTPYIKSQIENAVVGGTIPTIAQGKINNFFFIIPPVPEQRIIADFLDGKCAEIDGLLADLEAEVKTLAEYKKSIIAETVTRGLNPNAPMKQSGIPWAETIPEHWLVEPIYTKFHDCIYKNLDYEYQKAFKFNYGTLKYKDEAGDLSLYKATYINYSKVKKRDIIINGLNLNYDFISQRVAITPEDGIITSAYIALRPLKGVNSVYFNYLFKAMDNMKLFHGMGKGIRLTLSFDELKRVKIPIPSTQEQVKITNYLNWKCAAIDQSIADKQTQIETLKAYKSSLIYEYVTGKKQVI